jgi:predicted  nucleic acid-binding Zn-ribbon protein
MVQEGLKIVIDAETKEALTGFKDLITGLDGVDNAAVTFNKSMAEMQNELKGLKKELTLATDATRIKELNSAINKTSDSIRKQSEALQILTNGINKQSDATDKLGAKQEEVSKKSGGASIALTNFSRVIQDAPFGILGVANNIDPLLSSFQNLKKETGSTKDAFKAMVAGLTGPAGVAIAVSALTSAFIAFGPAIGDAIANISAFDNAQREAAENGAKEFIKAQQEFTKYSDTINDGASSYERQKDALNSVNSLIGEYGLKIKSLSDFQRIGAQVGAIYAEIKREEAKASILSAKAAEAYAKSVALSIKAQQGDVVGLLKEYSFLDAIISGLEIASATGAGQGSAIAYAKAVTKTSQEQKLFNAEADVSNNRIKELTKSLGAIQGVTEDFGVKTGNNTKKNKENIDSIQKSIIEFLALNKIIDKTNFRPVDTSLVAIPKPPPLPIQADQEKQLNPAITARAQNMIKLTQATFDAKNAQEAYNMQLQEANVYASLLFPAIDNIFNALASGGDVFQALGDGLKRLAIDLAAAAAKAAILAGIMSLLPGGAAVGAAAGKGGFGSLFKGLLGFANGGIVSKPTIGVVGERNESEAIMPLSRLSGMLNMAANIGASNMSGSGEFVIRGNDLVLATNRANSSLNLRR